MLENSIYSILSPEGFASILYKDANKNKEAAEMMKITAKDLKNYEVIDEIIKENYNEEEKYNNEFYKNVKKSLIKHLKQLTKENIETLLEKRYEKFRKMGKVI